MKKCFSYGSYVFFLLLGSNCLAQTDSSAHDLRNYRVVWRGDSIGYLTTVKKDSFEITNYRIESFSSIWFLGRRRIKSTYLTTYKRDTLVTASTNDKVNNSDRSFSRIALRENRYKVNLDDEDESFIEEIPISTSVVNLYYQEPKGLDRIFSEKYGEFLKVEDLGKGHYKLIKPSGRYNLYSFKGNICERVEVNNFFTTFYFELIPN